jgi:mannose/fructose/N-acetylgalactosamine-specific phosphotransferase system component IID
MMVFTLLGVFVRSFFLQTLWNFERMQNVGFAFSVEPLLRLAHHTKEGFHAALRRHLGFFNAHPYLATTVIGVVYNSEKLTTPQDMKAAETALVLKDSMGGAFGAIGDHVLWGTWRPFCAVLAMSVGLWVAYPAKATGALGYSFFQAPAAILCAKWWAAGFLGLFNAVHVWLRWRGLQRSVAVGPQVVGWVQSLHLQPWAAQIRRLGILAMVIMILLYLARWRSSDMLFWMFAILLGTMVLKRWAVSGWVIFYTVCAASFVMTKLGVTWPY